MPTNAHAILDPSSLTAHADGHWLGWDTIPALGATAGEQLAEQTNICFRASQTADSYLNQTLRADVALEELRAPDYRANIPGTGTGSLQILASRWPVAQVVGAQVSPATSFPPAWVSIPPEYLRLGFYGLQTISGTASTDASGVGTMWIEIAPGYVNWASGRNAWRIQIAYINGWPHTSLTAAATSGTDTLEVDDVTGWAGYNGQIYDGAQTEGITGSEATATSPLTVIGQTVQSGPGTLTLASPLQFGHPAGTLVTAMPYNVIWAVALFASAEALTRGATAVTVPGIPGSMTGGGTDVDGLVKRAQDLLAPYKRII